MAHRHLRAIVPGIVRTGFVRMPVLGEALIGCKSGIYFLAGVGFRCESGSGVEPFGAWRATALRAGYSTILGTMKRPLAWAGALRRASSWLREGRTSSGRVTLISGNAWAVGSTPLTSTSFSFSI